MKLNQLPDRTLTRGVAKPRHLARLTVMIGVLLVSSGTAMAQSPFMFVDDASVFESNAGNTVLKLPVRFVGTQNTTVTGVVSAIALTGTGFNTPVGGTCGNSGVDFQPFNNVPFSIPPNTPNGTLSVNILICSDATIEPDEQIFVFFSNVVGADCSLEGACNGIGNIVNDDGPPAITINNIVVSTVSGIRKNAVFTVSLHHPSTSPVSVDFVTRDGSAKALGPFQFGSYLAKSGTLTIQPAVAPNPPNMTGTISVTVLGTGGGTFFVDLSDPVNGTIGDGTGQATIRIIDLTIGSFDVTPEAASVPVGGRVNYAVTWTVPESEVWRNLNTIDFRLQKGSHTAMWLRWDETANTFSLCENTGHHGRGHEDDGNVVCGPGLPPGNPNVLETEFARLYLANSSVVGSGPAGRSVTLNLSLSFLGNAAGHRYDVELAATDDFGRRDAFVEATSVQVEKLPKR